MHSELWSICRKNIVDLYTTNKHQEANQIRIIYTLTNFFKQFQDIKTKNVKCPKNAIQLRT